jgi:predicted metalloendopeptidase
MFETSLVLPLGLLHDPLFSLKTPNYLGLGTLGFIVAHEIMHGFDGSGVEFDEDGVRRNLLSPPSQRLFQQKMTCMSNQFSNSFQTEYLINGTSVVLKVRDISYTFIKQMNGKTMLYITNI